MALSLAQKFINLGMPSPLAVEFANQLNTGVYNWKRLMWNSMVPELAKYVAQSLAAGTFDPRIAMEKTMSEAVATLTSGGGGRLWVPTDLGPKLRAYWVSGQSTALAISGAPVSEFIIAAATLTSANTDRTLLGPTLDGGRQFRVNANETLNVNRRGRSVFATSTGAVPASGKILAEVEVALGSNATKWWNYGTTLGVSTQTTGFDVDAASATSVVGGPTDAFSGVDALISSDILTTAERQKVEGYMAWSHGDPTLLPVDHPYYAAPPRTSAFVQPAFDWWLSIGQSNGRGEGAGYNAGTDATPTYGAFQYDKTSDAIIAAINPMRDYDPLANRVGHTYAFAKGWKQKGKNCVILPFCEGSTALVGGVWAAPSGARYLSALNGAAAFAVAYPQGRFCGFLWDQGEQDAFNGVTKANYEAAAVTMFAGLRAGIPDAANKPILVTGLAPQWIAGGAAAAQVIDNALRNLPNLISNCTYVDPVGLTSNDTSADVIHFDAASQRTLATRNLNAAAAYYPEVA